MLELRPKFCNPKAKCLFARASTSLNSESGGEVLKKAALAAGIANPGAFRGTLLRKQLATMTKAQHLPDEDIEEIAEFMQHNMDVHRKYYTLPISTVQKHNVTKVLWAMSFGADTAAVCTTSNSQESEGNICLMLRRCIR